MRVKLQKTGFATLCVFLVSGCVTIPNSRRCAIAGVITAGAICAETQTNKTYDLDFAQTLDLLEPHDGKPGAIIIPFDDYMAEKQAYEKACRLLGNRCQREFKQVIDGMDRVLNTFQTQAKTAY